MCIILSPEDRRLLRVFLVKVDKTAGNCWPSLLVNQFEANFCTKNEMEKKLTLQRFQLEVIMQLNIYLEKFQFYSFSGNIMQFRLS